MKKILLLLLSIAPMSSSIAMNEKVKKIEVDKVYREVGDIIESSKDKIKEFLSLKFLKGELEKIKRIKEEKNKIIKKVDGSDLNDILLKSKEINYLKKKVDKSILKFFNKVENLLDDLIENREKIVKIMEDSLGMEVKY